MTTQKVKRFPLYFVLVHAVLVTTFTICTLTGLPLKFEWWAVTNALGGHGVVKWIHRVAGAIMIIDTLLYALFALAGELKSGFKGGFWPRWRDIGDCIHELKYLIGAAKERPKFGKFTYRNKMEFWLGSAGIVLMSISGVVLWFPKMTSPLIIESCHVIHSWEAVLALFAIYIWHVYNVHTLRGKPRINTVWLNGEISVEELKEEFPAEYESLLAKGEISTK